MSGVGNPDQEKPLLSSHHLTPDSVSVFLRLLLATEKKIITQDQQRF